ncbi:cytochrome P450 [Mycolicibacterium holsaticum]|uniref:cytochrome P450 n=1 Tax=Mycolicibacterium holsaticum TaxID=152142 RepID=UPI001E5AED94|nr:cytochrome P450 [Mycolicibacterium holsaticum]
MPIRSQMRFLKMYGPSLAVGFAHDVSHLVMRKVRRAPVPPGVEVTDFDPLDPQTAADPYPHYRQLLQSGPVHYNPKRDIFILSRYEDVRAGARTHEVFSSADGISYNRMRAPSLLTVDPPRHTQMRKQAQPAFTRGALESWQSTVVQLARDHTARLFDNPPVDIVQLRLPSPFRPP